MRLWKPALFSTPMVQTILDGHKTMTRRVTRPQPDEDPGRPLAVIGDLLYRWVAVPARATSPMAPERAGFAVLGNHKPIRCPWPVRTRLYVKEKWGCPDADHPRCKDGRKPRAGDRFVYGADPADAYQWRGGGGCGDFAWRSSRFMFRFVARIGLEVTAVRCQQVQDITIRDAIHEGIDLGMTSCDGDARLADTLACPPHVYDDWIALWDSLNAKRGYGWAVNPWVFAYTFTVLSTDYAETQRLMTEDAA